MGQLNVGEIRNEAGSATVPPSIPGLLAVIPTVWVRFNGTGVPAITDSHNVSSITDNGTGKYTVNFTTDLDNVNYSAYAQGTNDTTTGPGANADVINIFNFLAGSIDVYSYFNVPTSPSVFGDFEIVSVLVLGGKE